MIKIVNEDIMNAKEYIIAHQVNCFTMGSGLAKTIFTKYPKVKTEHAKIVQQYKGNEKALLGTAQLVHVGDHVIANCFGQYNYGRDKTVVYTDYNALRISFMCVRARMSVDPTLTLAIPYNIGCGLANGDWNKVIKIIKNVFEKYDNRVKIYKL